MRIKYLLSFIVFLAASTFYCVEAQVVDYGQRNGVFSFEKDSEGFMPSRHSESGISNEHAKLGTHSLEWSWRKKGASISLDTPIPYLPKNPDPKETSVSSFVFWIYSPEILDGSLRFSFLKDGRECCHFDYTLGFEGWRGAWVAFDRDMEGMPETGMDRIVITASDGMKKGRLFFDGIITASFQDVRYHTADWQARFINKETTSFWLTLNRFWDTRLDIPVEDSISGKEAADFKTIEERFITLVTDGVKPWSIEKIRETYRSYGISVNPDGTVKGKPIWFVRYGETYINQGIPDAGQAFTGCGQLLKQINDSMLNIAVSYMHETDPAVREEIAGIYVSLVRHILDQGFAAGSGQGTLHHLGYSMRNFYTGPVIMKEVLEKEGLADDMQKAMEWFCGVGETKAAPEVPGMDVDAFNTSLMGRFASVIMLEDTPYKQAYMKALSRWVDNGFKHTEGLRPCFKRDGSVVHHRKSYPEYAAGGFKGAVNAIWMLAGTSFSVSEESHENQKQALLAMRFYSNLKSFPLAMSGRHPDGTRSLIPEQFAILADAGSPDGKESIDHELAAAYLRLNGTSGKWGEKFTEAGFIAEKAPVGGHYFGYNCSLSYRQDDWLVTIAGHSRYLWAAETYQHENHYGRYLTHGSMQIMPGKDSFESGFRLEGWDWCHIPGTTAAAIPMEKMKADVLNVDEYSGYEEMLLSDELFAGGTSFGNIAAAYSMILHEHDKYNGSLRARKSFFAFGNRIIAIGTGLENSLEGSELHTTLFQNSLTEPSQTTIINGSAYSDKNLSMGLDRDLTLLTDRLGNSYFVKNAAVTVTRGLQHSFHEETDAPTQGEFEKAYISHGGICGPDEESCRDSYEYMTAIQASTEDIERYSSCLPYTVIRKDNAAHVVRDEETGLTGCTAFETTSVDEVILETSPAVLIYKVTGDEMYLSISNPDLALYEGPSDEIFDEEGKRTERSVYGRTWIENPAHPTVITLILDGYWEITDDGESEVAATVENGRTELSFTTLESRTEEIVMKKTQNTCAL